MFSARKFLVPLIYPFPLSVELLLLGVLILVLTRKQTLGKILVVLGSLLLLVSSEQPLADRFLSPLEDASVSPAPLLSPGTSWTGDEKSVRWIVVLGGGTTADPGVPVPDRLSGATLSRLVQGICIYRQMPGSRLVLSGGEVFNQVADAVAMRDVALMLGVPPGDIVLDSTSVDTYLQAVNLRPVLKNEKFFLVTSAFHMPRASAYFTAQGMHPIPAPTGYMVKRNSRLKPESILPSVEGLAETQRSFHEYLGTLWAKLTGKAS